MIKLNEKKIQKKSNKKSTSIGKKAALYSFGHVADTASYQSFTLLSFVFYFAIVKVPTLYITIGFCIWSIWNAFNDPLLGYFSDRTHTKWGRRIPYIMVAFVPLAILSILLYTPPLPGSEAPTGQLINFIYFLIIIIVFELFYTMFSINMVSLFPEIFLSDEERRVGNNIRQFFLIIGLLIGVILPGIIIGDFTNESSHFNYIIVGIIIAVTIILGALIFLIFGPKERKTFKEDYKNAPPFFQSLKLCIKSKSFMWYIPAEIANWFVYGLLLPIVPLYGEFVLGLEEGAVMISLFLAATFLSAVLFITVIWKPVVRKIGNRKAWLCSMSIWIATLIPLFFLGPGMEIIALICFFFIGLGLAGSLYIIDLIISDIVDQDEATCGYRREAAYYGVNALFMRFSTIFVMISIGLVFTSSGWQVFKPENVTATTILGLKFLMVILPIIALLISIIAIYKYPLHGEKLKNVKKELDKIHQEKESKIKGLT